MPRRAPLALLSVAALAGAAGALLLAPAAGADPAPVTPTMHADSDHYQPGDSITISGTGCLGGNSGTTAAATTDPATTAAAAAADDPAGSVNVDIAGIGSSSATAELGGTWSASPVFITDDVAPGDYTVTASCTIAQVVGVPITISYDPITVHVNAPPPPVLTPSATCAGCSGVNPGGVVTVSGSQFQPGEQVTVQLQGYDPATYTASNDAQGAFTARPIVIRADQPAGQLPLTLRGTAGSSVDLTVTVVVPNTGGGNADSGDFGGNGGTGSGTDAGPVTTTGTGGTSSGTSSSFPSGRRTSAATLPATGTDATWPGLLGGVLVATGAGLVWLGRRRAQAADVTS